MSDPSGLEVPTLPDGRRAAVLVGFSGGLDSTVLLHLLASSPTIRDGGLRAIHVHHGLQAQADAWAAHCAASCAELGIELVQARVVVDHAPGSGPEGAAREARHAAFAEALREGEVLALAHHRDDQAETFLLRALRASGPDGLAAMRPWRRFARGWLWRPLLETPRAALLAQAQAHGLRWIEDPSNADIALDRGFLRRRVMPLLRERWPSADAAFARAASLQAEAAGLLAEGDATALASARTLDPQVLSADVLRALPPSRRARVLRAWIASLRLPPLSARGVTRIASGLLDAPADAVPAFAWRTAVVRRWRGLLHAGPQRAPLPAGWSATWSLEAPLVLPTGDRLELAFAGGDGVNRGFPSNAAAEGPSIRAAPAATGPLSAAWVRVHARSGGERIVLPGRTHSHALKHVLQELGVPPWDRERLPLLSDADGRLLAAGDLVYSAGFDGWLRERGARLHWIRPALVRDIRPARPAAPGRRSCSRLAPCRAKPKTMPPRSPISRPRSRRSSSWSSRWSAAR